MNWQDASLYDPYEYDEAAYTADDMPRPPKKSPLLDPELRRLIDMVQEPSSVSETGYSPIPQNNPYESQAVAEPQNQSPMPLRTGWETAAQPTEQWAPEYSGGMDAEGFLKALQPRRYQHTPGEMSSSDRFEGGELLGPAAGLVGAGKLASGEYAGRPQSSAGPLQDIIPGLAGWADAPAKGAIAGAAALPLAAGLTKASREALEKAATSYKGPLRWAMENFSPKEVEIPNIPRDYKYPLHFLVNSDKATGLYEELLSRSGLPDALAYYHSLWRQPPGNLNPTIAKYIREGGLKQTIGDMVVAAKSSAPLSLFHEAWHALGKRATSPDAQGPMQKQLIETIAPGMLPSELGRVLTGYGEELYNALPAKGRAGMQSYVDRLYKDAPTQDPEAITALLREVGYHPRRLASKTRMSDFGAEQLVRKHQLFADELPAEAMDALSFARRTKMPVPDAMDLLAAIDARIPIIGRAKREAMKLVPDSVLRAVGSQPSILY